MENKSRSIVHITFVLGIITVLWLAWTLYQVNAHLREILGGSETGYLMMAGYLIMFLFHCLSFGAIIMHQYAIRRGGVLKISMFALGIVSFIMIAVEKVMFDEIARQAEATGETAILNGCLIVNVLFAAAMLFFLLRVLFGSHEVHLSSAERDDAFFSIVQYMGIIVGVLGILLSISVLQRQVPITKFWVYLPFYAMFFIPYFIATACWFTLKLKVRMADWYDEKQWRDMLQAAFAAMVISVPGLAMLFLVGKPTGYYWFPYYCFMMVLLFSGGTLYFYKRG